MKRALIVCIVFLFPACEAFAQAPSQPQKPFSKVELLALLISNPRYGLIDQTVAKRGIDFHATEDYVNWLEAAGADPTLIEAVRKAPGTGVSDSSHHEIAKRENAILSHLGKGGKLKLERSWREAEHEFRSALAIDPDNPLLHVDLAEVLPGSQGDLGWEAAIAENHQALRLDPDLAVAHFLLAGELLHQQDTAGAISEYREAARLDPEDMYTRGQIGRLLEAAGDLDGAMAAFREVLAARPNADWVHLQLSELLEKKDDLDGAISEAREAVRIAPNKVDGHLALAKLLQKKGDSDEAAKEAQAAAALQPKSKPGRLRVGGQLMATKLIHQVRPTYPDGLKRAGIQGPVRLDVVIGKDGAVQDVRVISGLPELAKPAMEAVAKWRYQPTLLKGEPVEVMTEIIVNFTLTGM
jgi:TonB family protein